MPAAENVSDQRAAVQTAERLLCGSWGATVDLDAGAALDERTHVIRCGVRASRPGAPASVIVKRSARGDSAAHDPGDLTPYGDTWRFVRDWLGVQFLSGLSSGAPIAPCFFGGDLTAGVFVMEDLGEGGSLADLLLGDDPVRAEEGLLAFAAALGRMHACTLGREAPFQELCAAMGVEYSAIAADSATSAPAEVASMCQYRGMLGIQPDPRVEEEMAGAFDHAPGPYCAYTHGDPCPDNTRLLQGGMRLFDFEHGAFRHALLDGVYGFVPFPTCWCVNRLPGHLPARMAEAYRAELGQVYPAILDDAVYHREAVRICAMWVVTTMRWGFEKALASDSTWGIASMRQRYLLRLRTFAELTGDWGQMKRTGALAREMADRLEASWGGTTEPMPLYPAFRRA